MARLPLLFLYLRWRRSFEQSQAPVLTPMKVLYNFYLVTYLMFMQPQVPLARSTAAAAAADLDLVNCIVRILKLILLLY